MSNSIDQMHADLESHHIEGIAIADPSHRRFTVPLISHIHGNLWMGGCIDGLRLPDDFDTVISLYPWGKYELGPTTSRVEYRLYDGEEIPDKAQLQEVVNDILFSLSSSGKTLVHCQAGLNRSGLVTAIALHQRGGFDNHPCESMDDVIALLREKRSPVVLCNPVFKAYLRSLP